MNSRAYVSVMIVFLMSVSAFGSIMSAIQESPEEDKVELEEIPQTMGASDPGHVVFAQYITSDNCGFCYQYGSPALSKLKTDWPDRMVYIAYQSVSYGDTDTARAGNVNVYNWPWSSSGAPDSNWGDRLDKNAGGCGSNTCYDSMFNSGGGMSASTVGKYGLISQVNANGNYIDISVAAKYIGSGTPPSNVYLYAALTEDTCNSYVYADGSKGHHCWKSWLTSSGTYKSATGGTGNSFESVSLSSSSWTSYSWSVPASLVSGGAANALAVAALMVGAPSTGASNEHTLTATDSSMGSLLDVSLDGPVSVSNSNSAGLPGYVNGDVITIDASITNNGIEDYSDGGYLKFYRIQGLSEVEFGSAAITNLVVGASQSAQASFDTTSLPSDAWDVQFVVRVEGPPSMNSNQMVQILHDMVPESKSPFVVGSPDVERGSSRMVEAKIQPNDGIDTMSTVTPTLKISKHGENAWSEDWVTDGDVLFGEGTSNERYEFSVTPPIDASAGTYDIALSFADSRGQISDWQIEESAFNLLNAAPVVTADPYESVRVDTNEMVSMVDHISDPETPLSQLDVTSNMPECAANSEDACFSWHPDTQNVEVRFTQIPLGSNGIPIAKSVSISVSDGDKITTDTLYFWVIENGMPRWDAIPTQSLNEGGMGLSLPLMQYLSDTDQQGNVVDDISGLTLEVVGIETIPGVGTSDESPIVAATLSGFTLNIEPVNDDDVGLAMITLRASDGIQESDTILTVSVNNVNDAPRLDLTGIENLETMLGEPIQFCSNADLCDFEFGSRITDVDDDDSEARFYSSVMADEPSAVDWNPVTGELTLDFETAGDHIVSVTTRDRHDATDVFSFTVSVFSELPLVLVTSASETGDVLMEWEDMYAGLAPTVTFTLHSDIGLQDLAADWQMCDMTTGICLYNMPSTLADGQGPWSITVVFADAPILLYNYELKVSLDGIDSDGTDRKMDSYYKWEITEYPPQDIPLDEMTDEQLQQKMTELAASLILLESELNALEAGSDAKAEKQSEIDLVSKNIEEVNCAMDEKTCPGADVSGSSDGMFSDNTLLLVLAALGGILVLVIVVAFVTSRRSGRNDGLVDWGAQVPAMDPVANSMYGGASDIFQAPIQPTAAPVAPAAVPGGAPPIPPGGIPPGWTMEQWQVYGQQYLTEKGLN